MSPARDIGRCGCDDRGIIDGPNRGRSRPRKANLGILIARSASDPAGLHCKSPNSLDLGNPAATLDTRGPGD